MSFAVDSHAKICLARGKPRRPIRRPVQDSTGNWCEPFAWFDPASRFWRTLQGSFLDPQTTQADGFTNRSRGLGRKPGHCGWIEWDCVSASTRRALLTNASASGLLPTPNVTDEMVPRSDLKPLRWQDEWCRSIGGRLAAVCDVADPPREQVGTAGQSRRLVGMESSASRRYCRRRWLRC